MALGLRDREYVESRLISPCERVMEAHGRLTQAGEHDAAHELMTVMQEFTDKCRNIRHELLFGKYRNAV